jgi:hypothetical protein
MLYKALSLAEFLDSPSVFYFARASEILTLLVVACIHLPVLHNILMQSLFFLKL